MVRMKEEEIKNSIQKSFTNAMSSSPSTARRLPTSSSEEEVPQKEHLLEDNSTHTTPSEVETKAAEKAADESDQAQGTKEEADHTNSDSVVKENELQRFVVSQRILTGLLTALYQ